MGSGKREKKQKKSRRPKAGHALYALVVLLLGIAIIVMTVLLVFHVQTIEITGNEYVDSSEIADSIQSDKNTKNSLYLLGKYALGDITFPKAVESVKIRMKAPWSIRVEVKEREIVGYITGGEEYIYFADDGTVLSKSVTRMEGIPHIEGVTAGEVELYEKLPVEDRLFRNLMDATEAFAQYGITADRIISSGVDLTVYSGSICFDLGSGDMELKISQIPPVLEKLSGKSGTLDLKHYNEASEIISFKEGEFPETPEE